MRKHGTTLRVLALSLPLLSTSILAGVFPDYGYAPPKGEYSGVPFSLSQSYPQQAPDASALPAFFKQLPQTFSNDFETWRQYMDAVKAYCLEGNSEVWDVQNNPVRKWYHMPWQHYGPQGREGINGLTKEAAIKALQLAPSQKTEGQTYAVGVYNDIGAYTIGQVWKDPQNPNPSYTAAPNSFTHGTVVCKPLFAYVPLEEVPFLQNPVLWQAYITKDFLSADRKVANVALIQMDIAVRDSRVPGTGWLFGTFQYNGENAKKASWDNLVPVGIMWGNDPEVTDSDYNNPQPKQTKINPNLKQTAINAQAELPATHLGWNGRLNGPVDNPISSCLSCHMTSEYPQKAPMNPTFQAPPYPEQGSPEWMRWFQNIEAGKSFSPSTQSTDYSLQLSAGLANFYDWKCNQGGIFADGVNACQQSKNLKLLLNATPDTGVVYPVVRGTEMLELE